MRVIKNKNFMILWLAQSISKLGTSLYDIALMWYIYKRTGSAMALGLSVLCFTVPTVLVTPLAGVFADKLDKKKIIINTDILNVIIMLILSYAIFINRCQIYILYIFMILASVVTELFNPAMSATIPIILDENDLKDANTLNQIISQAINILGPALAGILIAFINMWMLFFINGVSFLICAVTESFVIIPKIAANNGNKGIGSQFKEGLLYTVKNKQLLWLVIAGGVIINFFLAPISIYETVLSTKILHVGSTGFGMMNSAISVGALVGALLIMSNVLKIFTNKYKMAVVGLCMEGVAVVLIGVVSNYCIVLIGDAILGFGIAMASVGISTLYQTMIPKDKMGRVMALVSTLCAVTVPIGTLIGSIVITYISLSTVLIVSGVFVLITGVKLVYIFKIELLTRN